ncbi:Transmembrane_domain-containing protein [Hexamita inflata]|uniref:Transmembrane domain-containing protein n=1 Tax=Hexamita inflata TaxID=28002 RepID=A0AA86N8A3_9EUKA|nr:Transmembrane domain-containing protein [Hexamita inflata]
MQILVFVQASTSISTATQLNSSTSDIVLANSISLASGFLQIDNFTGLFDGAGFELSDFDSQLPFIRSCVNCVFLNVTFVHFKIRANISSLILEARNLNFTSVQLNFSSFSGNFSASSLVYYSTSNLLLENVTISGVQLNALTESGIFSVSTFTPIIRNSYVQIQSTNGAGICNMTVSLTIYDSEMHFETSNIVIGQLNAIANTVEQQVLVNNSAFDIICNHCDIIVVMPMASNIIRQANFSYFNITSYNANVDVTNFFDFYSSFMNFKNQIKVVRAIVGKDNCSYIYYNTVNKPMCTSTTCDMYTLSSISTLNTTLTACAYKIPPSTDTLRFETNFSLQMDGTNYFCPTFQCVCSANYTGSRCSQCKYFKNGLSCTDKVPNSHGNCTQNDIAVVCTPPCDAGYVMNTLQSKCELDQSKIKCNFGTVVVGETLSCACDPGYESSGGVYCTTCSYGYQKFNGICYQAVSNSNGDCYQGEGKIVCTKCNLNYKLENQVCKEEIDIIYIILGVICGFVILVSAIVIFIISCQLKQFRKPQFLTFNPTALLSDAAWQGKVVKAEKFGDLMRM